MRLQVCLLGSGNKRRDQLQTSTVKGNCKKQFQSRKNKDEFLFWIYKKKILC